MPLPVTRSRPCSRPLAWCRWQGRRGSRRCDTSAGGGRRSCSVRRRASGNDRARRIPSARGHAAAVAPGTAAPGGCVATCPARQDRCARTARSCNMRCMSHRARPQAFRHGSQPASPPATGQAPAPCVAVSLTCGVRPRIGRPDSVGATTTAVRRSRRCGPASPVVPAPPCPSWCRRAGTCARRWP